MTCNHYIENKKTTREQDVYPLIPGWFLFYTEFSLFDRHWYLLFDVA